MEPAASLSLLWTRSRIFANARFKRMTYSNLMEIRRRSFKYSNQFLWTGRSSRILHRAYVGPSPSSSSSVTLNWPLTPQRLKILHVRVCWTICLNISSFRMIQPTCSSIRLQETWLVCRCTVIAQISECRPRERGWYLTGWCRLECYFLRVEITQGNK